MALSPATELWWGRTKTYFITSTADIPTFDASGQAFNVGDFLFNIVPANNVPAIWQCTSTGALNQNPVFQPLSISGGGTSRVSASPTTIAPTDSNLIITSAGTITAPAAATLPNGSPITIINASAGSITITPVSGTISGLASVILTNGGTASIENLGGTLYSV